MKGFLTVFTSALVFATFTLAGRAASLPDRLDEAIDIVSQRQGSAYPIPQSLLNNARGVAIVKVTKAGLVFGGTGGQGVVLARTATGWSAPSAFNISGGSFGAQVGFETKRFIIVINSEAALRLFAGEGETKWDATAAGTAGTDAVHASQSDWANMPLVVFQDSNGVFGGATFGGTSVNVDHEANHRAYGPDVYVRDILGGKFPAGPLGRRLQAVLSGHR